MNDLEAKMLTLTGRHTDAVRKLLNAARAAANAMEDAKLSKSAAPLFEALFEIDALDQEMLDLIKLNPAGMLDLFTKRFGDAV